LAIGDATTAADEEAGESAAQISASRAPGKIARAAVFGCAPDSQRRAPSASTTAMPATATKAPRQWP
jgi:hypothetical protein